MRRIKTERVKTKSNASDQQGECWTTRYASDNGAECRDAM